MGFVGFVTFCKGGGLCGFCDGRHVFYQYRCHPFAWGDQIQAWRSPCIDGVLVRQGGYLFDLLPACGKGSIGWRGVLEGGFRRGLVICWGAFMQ